MKLAAKQAMLNEFNEHTTTRYTSFFFVSYNRVWSDET